MGKLQDIVSSLGAKNYREGEPWNSKKVYIPVYIGNPIIGLPLVVFQEGKEFRVSTDEESLKYIAFINRVKKMGE